MLMVVVSEVEVDETKVEYVKYVDSKKGRRIGWEEDAWKVLGCRRCDGLEILAILKTGYLAKSTEAFVCAAQKH